MNQCLKVKPGQIQVRTKEQCFKIMINLLLKLPHEEGNPSSQTQVPFWKTCFRQIQEVELRMRADEWDFLEVVLPVYLDLKCRYLLITWFQILLLNTKGSKQKYMLKDYKPDLQFIPSKVGKPQEKIMFSSPWKHEHIEEIKTLVVAW